MKVKFGDVKDYFKLQSKDKYIVFLYPKHEALTSIFEEFCYELGNNEGLKRMISFIKNMFNIDVNRANIHDFINGSDYIELEFDTIHKGNDYLWKMYDLTEKLCYAEYWVDGKLFEDNT
jgi:hypothetical protein